MMRGYRSNLTAVRPRRPIALRRWVYVALRVLGHVLPLSFLVRS
jgi:hypothetical protein